MTEQCRAEIYSRNPRRVWRRCKFGVAAGSELCRRHTRTGVRPKPAQCQHEVFTYSQRGHHQCYRASVERVDGEWVCAQHAAVVRREMARGVAA